MDFTQNMRNPAFERTKIKPDVPSRYGAHTSYDLVYRLERHVLMHEVVLPASGVAGRMYIISLSSPTMRTIYLLILLCTVLCFQHYDGRAFVRPRDGDDTRRHGKESAAGVCQTRNKWRYVH